MSVYLRKMIEVMRRIRPEQTIVCCAMCRAPGWIVKIDPDFTAYIDHIGRRRCRAEWVFRRQMEEVL